MGASRKIFAVIVGIVTHACFALAVSHMFFSLLTGFRYSIGTLDGGSRWTANIFLLLQFPLMHSLLLSKKGRRVLALRSERLAITWYVLLSASDLLITFLLWSPETPAPASGGMWATLLFVLSWIFLIRALYDAGLGLQLGYIGWVAEYRDTKPVFPGFRDRGLYTLVRHPIYLGFFLVILTAPFWNGDKTLIFSLWGLYCLIGPKLKERRLLKTFGERYRLYQQTVPYFIPRIRPRPRSQEKQGNIT